MRTKTFHAANMGSFSPVAYADCDGYITCHASPRYSRATDEQLEAWRDSPLKVVRAAAAVELAERAIDKWRQL